MTSFSRFAALAGLTAMLALPAAGFADTPLHCQETTGQDRANCVLHLHGTNRFLSSSSSSSSSVSLGLPNTGTMASLTRTCAQMRTAFLQDRKVRTREWRLEHPTERTLAWRNLYKQWRNDMNTELRRMLARVRAGDCGQVTSSSSSSRSSSSSSFSSSSMSSSSSLSSSSSVSSSSPSAGTSASVSVSVTPATMHARIENFVFYPSTIRVRKGTTVTWTNNDTTGHTITSDATTGFSSTSLKQGETFSKTFNDVGFFPYHDSLNTGMTGTVEVVE